MTHLRKILTIIFVLGMGSCFEAAAQVVDSAYLPQNVGPNVNGQYDDILPVISPDGLALYFCRSHSPENIGGGRQDIWLSEFQADGKWGLAKNVGIPLNNRDNNYLCSITPDGNTLIIGDGYSAATNRQRSIAISHRTADGWSVPKPVVIKNFYNDNRFGEYSFANDSRTLILAVERKDSRGGKDLYVCFRQEDSTFSEPMNMGIVVNSLGHEATPFIASDNSSLYFASDGQGGYGAFDVFVTRRLDSTWTNWSPPENLGPTINTAGWDLYYTIPASGDYAYYVSYSNTYGAGDIFRIRLPEKVRPRPVVLISGRVLNKKTNQPVEADIIYEILPEGKEVGRARSTPTTGNYKIVLPAGGKYGFRASAPNYLSVNDNLDLSGLTEYTEIKRDLFLVPIEAGSVAELNNIFFDYKKATLRPESFPELNRITDMLIAAPSMTIEIGGHTDAIASDQYNQVLSEERAESVVTYIVKRGNIDKARLVPKGYGERKPVASNDTDEGRQQNRRVEITIITK
ncbi:MAG: OmpA family protein [Ignavibacteria bacterium]|nr:OmpA family protein [Ignavibacteria bacterium]MBK6420119.1 OmpA family protein [Ignavibacteria bacterium]MBK7034315.1 OmpA family protein [Ignavibacteria bacterium]